MVIQEIPRSEKLFTGEDFNGHIGVDADGYDTAHGGCGLGRETAEEFLCWILQWPMNYRW